MELKELNWLCKRMKTVRSSQPCISINFNCLQLIFAFNWFNWLPSIAFQLILLPSIKNWVPNSVKHKFCYVGIVNPFLASVPFLYPLKTSEEQRFSEFSGESKKNIAKERVDTTVWAASMTVDTLSLKVGNLRSQIRGSQFGPCAAVNFSVCRN